MNQLWQMWIAALNSNDVTYLTDLCEKNTVEQTAKIGFDGNAQEVYRSSKVGWLDRNNIENKPLVDLLWRYTLEANRNAFGFDINYISEIQYTKYYGNTNDKYEWHVDTFWANRTSYDRKLSVVIQLSDPTEYKGGVFEFDPEIPQPNADDLRKKGTIIVFPSFIRHRVTPVTSGVRKSLVSWIEGPKFR